MSAFDIVIVAQSGRIEHEAALFAASLRVNSPGFAGRLFVAEPQPGPLWPKDPRMSGAVRAVLDRLDAIHLPFESPRFGAAYPQENKVAAMAALPDERPAVFFDSDTIITGEIGGLDLGATPTASMRRENTWPVDQPYGPEPEDIWAGLYDRFEADFASTVENSRPKSDWQRFLYFNAGLIFAPEPQRLAGTLSQIMHLIHDDPPPCQPLDPWLDQIALPIAVTKLGGGRPTGDFNRLDGALSIHYRKMPLLFATAPDAVIEGLGKVASPNWLKKVLKRYEPFRRFLYQGAGARARDLFDRDALPGTEKPIRQELRKNGLWIV
jgi:hypothetical protein